MAFTDFWKTFLEGEINEVFLYIAFYLIKIIHTFYFRFLFIPKRLGIVAANFPTWLAVLVAFIYIGSCLLFVETDSVQEKNFIHLGLQWW